MRKDQVNRDQLGELRGAGRIDESGRSKQPMPAATPEREEITGRHRTEDDDLVLHDDDEAELDLPR